METTRPRFLVLGLDGATFDLLGPWLASGELPFLRSLSDRGLRAPLTSVFPAKTIPAWYSFATGLDPGSLGIYGFTEPDGGPGRSRLVQTFRPAEAVWDRLSRGGKTVGVVNFPVHSGYALNGFVFPGMLTESPRTFPEGLRHDVESELGESCRPELPPYRATERASWMDGATDAVVQRGRISEILIDRYHPDFLFVLFRETDRIQHQHWHELDRPIQRVPEDLRRFWRAIDAACARIDAAFRADGRPAVTLIVSDHGAGAARSEFFTNRWLAGEGYLTFRSSRDDLRRRVVSRLLLATDHVPLARRLVGRVAERVRGSSRGERLTHRLAGDSSFEQVAASIDWTRTEAFSFPVPEGIYINRHNPKMTPERAAQVALEIREKLGRFPGARIEVFDPHELYRSNHVDRAPALLLRIDGMATDPRMDFSYPYPLLRRRPSYFYGDGVHRMNGILLAGGDGVPPARLAEPLSLLDLAPTVLEGMGHPIPRDLPGRSFADRLGLASA